MASGNDHSGGNGGSEGAAHGNAAQGAQLQLAQQLARETLNADHQALELDAKLAFRAENRS
ncbi:hypothetical protein F4556_000450 [Kitasatospora gansuensis]|uniref:Uncharacterized protein n=1 Tax=Kitasatospora gansuensis TaxID=258050 RepID=A0A7W7S6P5_9ACTN|nr:hypothetical protein [Kitasatospora gansuensis]MBB4944915.1 hypothetical protein [Kitasatospora gansuensis]